MHTYLRNALITGLLCLLAACGGGGGGNSAPGVEPGPPPPGGQVPPPPEVPDPSPSAYSQAEVLRATITAAAIGDDGRAVIDFQLADGNNVAITDLTGGDVRFVLAKLQTSPLGNFTGSWQSYVNQIEQPEVGIGTEPRLQATYERDGELLNNGDGTYRYTYATDVNALPQDILDQAAAEGLDLSYEPNRTHRVSMQFDNAPGKANPYFDWVPATGATDGVFGMHIAAIENCNLCHDKLAFHGGGRIEMEYCVTCHNPGTTDADSTNTVDMKVMTHKLHMGRNLPSVKNGEPYVIYGFRNSANDYSELGYPQDIRNCVNCHVGTGTDPGNPRLTLSAQGDNWNEVPGRAACGSCHEELDFDVHAGGNPDDSRCLGCHSNSGPAGSVASSHLIPEAEARKTLAAKITGVENTMPGEFPTVSFEITNPQTGDAYDIQNDPIFTGEGSRLAVGISWDTKDYNNAGNFNEDNPANNASQVQTDALAATPNGDGSYSVTMPVAVPDGSLAPGIAASGSGTASIEGHPVFPIGEDEDGDGNPDLVEVPLGDAHTFFSIDEADGVPVSRRRADDQEEVLANCNNCHVTLVFHGGNRSDNLETCATCHNPRNTDLRQRLIASDPPTDGKDEESIDFKTMVHGIHAPSLRDNALEIVGFRGFTTYRYTEEEVHYPGNLANCTACHGDAGFTLPLAQGVLGSTIDTGANLNDPTDDTVISPASATCYACHENAVARAHMESQGGSFSTTQAAIDAGDIVEQCELCHAEGRSSAVSEVHGL